MAKFSGYKCSLCDQMYDQDFSGYVCPKDSGNLDVIMDFDAIKRQNSHEQVLHSKDHSIWRYLPWIPIETSMGNKTPMQFVGGTPLFRYPEPQIFGIKDLFIKDESRNPTASFKDRASAVVVQRAKELKAEIVVTASTGNAGAALAGISAAVGQRSIIFAPRTAPPAKIAQLLVFGARVILVDGTYDDAFDLSIQATEEFGWYCRNTGHNAFTVEGKKTASFEIWESLYNSQGRLPIKCSNLTILVSVGDGNIISGIHKGFKDLLSLGLIDQIPRIIGVQSENSAAISNAFHANSEKIIPVKATTIADSISVDLPRDGVRAVRAASQTGGTYITVKDEEIIQAIPQLGKYGVFAEPAGAAAFAGFRKAFRMELFNSNSQVIVMNTGSGLKDINSAMKSVVPAPIIQPSLSELKKIL